MVSRPSEPPAEQGAEPHAARVVVWDVPPAVAAGERFRITVGIKCSSECRLANGRFDVYDHTGARAATGALSGDQWPGTSGLFVGHVELDAPAGDGLYTWSVRGPDAWVAGPHAEGTASVGIRVVASPEHLVTIEAIDAESGVPLAGARVVMHPYHAVTDERGVAEVRVAKGAYRLFVSQTRYLTVGTPVEVGANLTTRVELSLERVPERN